LTTDLNGKVLPLRLNGGNVAEVVAAAGKSITQTTTP
jgi:hypothetical protein